MGVLGTENDELSRPDPDEKLRPVCKKPNVFFRIERPPGNTALPTLPPTHRFDFAGDQYLYVDIFIVHLQRSLLFPFELPFCHFHKNFSSFVSYRPGSRVFKSAAARYSNARFNRESAPQ